MESREAQELASSQKTEGSMPADQQKALCDWFDGALGDKISEIVATYRPNGVPGMIIDPTSAVMRRMMAMAPGSPLSQLPLPPQKLEINTASSVILGIDKMRKDDEEAAKMIAEQIMDNALIAAGGFRPGKAPFRNLTFHFRLAGRC